MMNWHITFQPFLPWPVIAVFAVLALLACVALARKSILNALLRLALAACLCAALANPQLAQEQRQPISNIAVIIVDRSGSNELSDRTKQTETALAELQSRIAALPNTETRIVDVTSGTSAQDDGTRLFAGLARAASEIPPERFAGAFFITDGEAHDAPLAADFGKLPKPLHALITGSKSEQDRRIVIDQAPRFAIVGQDQKLVFHVEDQGGDGSQVQVTINMDGLDEPPMSVPPGVKIEIPFKLSHAGQNLIELSAAARSGELSLTNNHAIASISGVRDRLRVLLVSGEPHPGERTWRNLLKADAAVDLVQFTILRPPEKQDGTPVKELSLIAFPTKELFLDKLDKFDLVVFDRFRRQAILPDLYLANIVDYVNKGGAILVSSGPDLADPDGLAQTPLGDVLPALPTGEVTETPFKPLLTALGLKHPVTKDLEGASDTDPKWGRWFRIVDTTVKPGSDTIMAGPDGKPLLVMAHVGEGRVAQIMSDQGWLWARGFDGGGPQTGLLRRIAHWLMKEPDLEEEALSARQLAKDIVIERRSLTDDHTTAKLTTPSGKTIEVPLRGTSPGLFTGQVPADEAGLYTLQEGNLHSAVAVGGTNNLEFSEILATDAKLKAPVAATGGGIAWVEAGLPKITTAVAPALMSGSGWMALRDNGLYRVTAIHQFPLLSTILVLAALLGLAALMWWREGR
jgi:hypothetical protein